MRPRKKAPQPGVAGQGHRQVRSKIRSTSRLCRFVLYSLALDTTTHCCPQLTYRKPILALMPTRGAGESIRVRWAGEILCALMLAGCVGIERPPPPEVRPLAAAPDAIALPAPSVTSLSPLAAPPQASTAEHAIVTDATQAAPAAQVVPEKPAAPAVPFALEKPAALPAQAAVEAKVTPEIPSATGITASVAAKPAVSPARTLASVSTPPPAAQSQKKEAPAPAFAKPEAPPPLDLKSLETRLRETKAIGVFTKLTVKNQVDDLLNQFRAYYQGKLKTTLAELRRSYDLLVLKVLALLQDADPPLASAIVASRESIWAILSNPAKFAAV
jgi:hypothetical protein